ncbi:DNA polymerase III subunit gamma/tau [Magnetovirga frankeli]|uniref:DNA polymerase III subunit gamma/tau n=1 Tax=Magnetovirga frankeli TaxID=947516 RepID=UPI0012930731|nr:DNA polymerase III subunit gamma/tau [gamma proteobacterium SS-5]
MSYQVLARKWRPRNFAELVGQGHVVRALGNALDNDRLHHAYLFTGTRGVGKTTLARILAKSLNCEQGVTSTPCGECSACRSIDEGRYVDLLEVDAASRTKVEQTRELLENVPYAPVAGRYKVYLIDEVHMFSDGSFNALLKTLEEPPPHVKFLLATTDPQKVPVTVLSRCLQFNLKQLPLELIQDHLRQILASEQIQAEAAALTILSRAAAGSMRDALSLLDQAIAFGAGQVKEADVRAMLGVIPQERLYQVLAAVAAGDGPGVLAGVAELADYAPDFASALQGLLLLLHRAALCQQITGAISDADADAEQVRALAQCISPEDAQLFYQIGLTGQRDLPYAPDPRSGFEMVLLRMLAFRPAGQGAQPGFVPVSGVKTAEKTPEPQPRPLPPSQSRSQPHPAQAVAERTDSAYAAPAAVPAAASAAAEDDWHQVTAAIAPALGGMAMQLAENCLLQGWRGDTLTLSLLPSGNSLAGERAVERLQRALSEYFRRDIKLQLKPLDAAPQQQQSPAERKAEQRAEHQRRAEDEFQANPYVQGLSRDFDAAVVNESIRPIEP